MALRLIRATPERHDLIVVMLRQQAAVWTEDRLNIQIQLGVLPAEFLDGAAAYVADKPALWTVSDEEFLGAVREVNPRCADLLSTPRGLAFLHKMSASLALHAGIHRVKALFGGGS